MKKAERILFLAIIFLTVFWVPSIQAVPYTYTFLHYPGSVSFQTTPIGLNNSGVIVGEYFLLNDPRDKGFVLTGTTYSTLNHPEGYSTSLKEINDTGQGQVVGRVDLSSDLNNDINRGFLYSGGPFTYVHPKDSSGSAAHGINNSGKVVGTTVQDGKNIGFFFDGTDFNFLDYPGSDRTGAYAINDADIIVGEYRIGNIKHGFTYSNGFFSPFDVPGAVETSVRGINNFNHKVGFYIDGSNVHHGFLFDGVYLETFDVPNATYTNLYDINDHGQLIGWANLGGGFLATPVPLPPTALLLGAGLTCLVILRKRIDI